MEGSSAKLNTQWPPNTSPLASLCRVVGEKKGQDSWILRAEPYISVAIQRKGIFFRIYNASFS